MNEIIIDWTMFPGLMLILRIYAVVLGLLMAGHFFQMVNADRGHAKWPLRIIITLLAAAGAYVAADAVFSTWWDPRPALYLTLPFAFVFYLWKHGFHMCDFTMSIRK